MIFQNITGVLLRITIVVGGVLISLLAYSLAWRSSWMSVWFLDVGQGDSTLISYQNYQILIDAGRDSAVVNEMGQILPFWDREIDILIITHPHSDHIGGVLDLLAVYEVNKVWMNDIAYDSGMNTLVKEALSNLSVEVSQYAAGSSIMIGDLKIEALWPEEEYRNRFNDEDVNEVAGVFQVELESAEFVFHLGSDVEYAEREQTIESWSGSVNVLKVPHQGSNGGISQNILGHLNPQVAIISVGKSNTYGHPHKNTLQLLNQNNIPVYQTDLQGTIRVEVSRDGKGTISYE